MTDTERPKRVAKPRALPAARAQYLSLAEYAERVGLTPGQLKNYAARGEIATPDVVVGSGRTAARGWSKRTVDAWQAERAVDAWQAERTAD